MQQWTFCLIKNYRISFLKKIRNFKENSPTGIALKPAYSVSPCIWGLVAPKRNSALRCCMRNGTLPSEVLIAYQHVTKDTVISTGAEELIVSNSAKKS